VNDENREPYIEEIRGHLANAGNARYNSTPLQSIAALLVVLRLVCDQLQRHENAIAAAEDDLAHERERQAWRGFPRTQAALASDRTEENLRHLGVPRPGPLPAITDPEQFVRDLWAAVDLLPSARIVHAATGIDKTFPTLVSRDRVHDTITDLLRARGIERRQIVDAQVMTEQARRESGVGVYVVAPLSPRESP